MPLEGESSLSLLTSGSIRTKLLGFVLLTAILPGAVYTLVTWQSSSNALREAIGLSYMQSAKASAEQISAIIESDVDTARLLAAHLALEVEEGEVDLAPSAGGADDEPGGGHTTLLLTELTGINEKKIRRYFIADAAGNVVFSEPSNTAPGNLSKESWWPQLAGLKGRRVFIGNLQREPATKKYSISIAVPLAGPTLNRAAGKANNRAAGAVFVGDFYLDNILRDIAKQKVGKSSHIDIFDANGMLILDKGKVLREKLPADLHKELIQSKPTWKVGHDEHGRLSLMGIAPVVFKTDFTGDLFGGENGWFVMIPQELFDAYAPLINLMVKLFILGALAVAIILITGYYRGQAIVGPLMKLSTGAREIGRGNLDFHVDLSTGDEIEDLADEFNRMAKALKGSQHYLQAANEELKRSSKLKSEFLANMSHELRTPLNSIIGFAEVVADQLFGPLNLKQQKYVNNIHSSGHHLLQLINDILDLSKIEADKLDLHVQEFAAAEVLRETIGALKALADKKDLEIDLKIDPKLETIAADEAKFKQIMFNLLSNAIKFTPNKERILVEARNEAGLAVISVIDHGIGISKKDQELIFEQFRQVSGSVTREFEGTGLGLALTKKLIELHGGRIWVTSEVGVGSNFTFTIPVSLTQYPAGPPEAKKIPAAATAAAETEARSLDRRPTSPAPHPTILVVEDDPSAAELMSIYLRDAEFEVIITGDAEEALELARTHQPFAITLDIMLPNKDGWQIIQELKNDPLTHDIPVIICSMVDDYELGISLGAVGQITKPIQRDKLIGLLNKCRKQTGQDKPYVILVADDDPNAVELVAAILEPEGFGVLKAYGGQEAIDTTLKYRPNLIVLDLMMPNVSGIDVVQALNDTEVGRDIPIIVLTAKELTDHDRQELNNSIERLMQKAQFKREDLIKEIRKLEWLEPHKAMLVDAETGLYNYRFFKRRLLEEEARALRYRREFSVILVDVANLAKLERASRVTDGSVLKDIARLLEQNVRGADPIARYTSNQFGIILPETTKTGGSQAAEKIRAILENYEVLDRETSEPTALNVAVSLAAFFEDASDSQGLIDLVEAGLERESAVRKQTSKGE